ncbi:MAG: DUF3372 domain-containing protein [Rhodoferax sp.]|nr:DUF3372 domain-containing protein [Rhodoferax sp.]
MKTLTFSLLLAACSVAGAQTLAGFDIEACHKGAAHTVLQAAPAAKPIAAQAYWLSRDLLSWPGQPAIGRYRLYHSAQAQLVAVVGTAPQGADGALDLRLAKEGPAVGIQKRFKFVGAGALLSVASADVPRVAELLRQQLVLVKEDDAGRVLAATQIQNPGALDDFYASAAQVPDLGAHFQPSGTSFKLWAPTARNVAVCVYGAAQGPAQTVEAMQRDDVTGVWQMQLPQRKAGSYYTYLVDVVVPGVGLVRNRVTDPYALSLNANSRRAYIADMQASALAPKGWATHKVPQRVKSQTDMVVYELHVRDFSINDATVAPAWRGKYMAFTQAKTHGMRHLRQLSQAGMTDVHLLPVFDLATVPEKDCSVPIVPQAAADSEAQQAAVMAQAGKDCFNWGYDPFHFNAPEGSFATNADDGAVRIHEFRAMVQALHQAGLRVGMDVVYNHMSASGQSEHSVLDRIVPGYYHRLDAQGKVERSTCCDNTATENLMMAKLMVDSVEVWVRDYKIDSFRFDLMGHQPRAVMEELQARANAAAGRHVHLIGEGWNFGEIENGKRFVQASQLSLNGSGIGTFSDRGRDAVRGGRAGEGGKDLIRNQGYVNGMVYDANAVSDAKPVDLLRTADMVRLGLAGSLRDYVMTNYLGQAKSLSAYDYGGQPAGYVSQPGEVVNYVENHDNQTLFDINAFKLPLSTSREDRARVQMLAMAINMFSQGVAYFHAGGESLRSKSLDGNSYDSGDWFNRLDWTFNDNYFGTGAPPKGDNGTNYPWIKPLLANPDIRPQGVNIRWARDQFNDLLRLRASSSLFRMPTAKDIQQRLTFFNTGPQQVPTVLVGHLRGDGYPQAGFREVLYLVNVDKVTQQVRVDALKGKPFVLHPVHLAKQAADQRPRREARFDAPQGIFQIPARTAAVFVVR